MNYLLLYKVKISECGSCDIIELLWCKKKSVMDIKRYSSSKLMFVIFSSICVCWLFRNGQELSPPFWLHLSFLAYASKV